MKRTTRSVLLELGTYLLLLAISTLPITAQTFPLPPDDPRVVAALEWLRSVQSDNGKIGSYIDSAWATVSIHASGQDPHTWRKPSSNLSVVDYLRRSVPQLTPNSRPTDYERNLLAIAHSGENPRDFGGIDFVAKVKEFFDGEQVGRKAQLNDDFFAVISLLAAGESPLDPVVQASRIYILQNRNADGGWSFLVSLESDVDDTAAAVMALAAVGDPADRLVMEEALLFLKARQNPDGAFPFFGGGGEESNAASTAWVIDAIVAAGGTPLSTRWQTSLGRDPVGGLLGLQMADGAFRCFLPTPRAEALTTSYAIAALLGRPYPGTL
ncbi:MAG: terpene cyclase/mutase family protein [Acidobacteria bacterium]|nr:terpene cyclase/mutase family protein [Acidobacteriota bacterium]